MRLYDLSEQYNTLAEMLEEDATNEALQTMLDGLEDAFDTKVESIIKLWRSKIGERDFIKQERMRLDLMEKRMEKQADWLKNYAESQMKAIGKQEIKSSLFKINLQNNPPKVIIQDGTQLPDEYINTHISVTPDKAKIKQAIDSGIELSGVTIIQEQSIRIK
jgi:hypothetical protein